VTRHRAKIDSYIAKHNVSAGRISKMSRQQKRFIAASRMRKAGLLPDMNKPTSAQRRSWARKQREFLRARGEPVRRNLRTKSSVKRSRQQKAMTKKYVAQLERKVYQLGGRLEKLRSYRRKHKAKKASKKAKKSSKKASKKARKRKSVKKASAGYSVTNL
jgi:hypothetical protein